MKLHILSDLHLDFSHIPLPPVEADVLVLAGDIAEGTRGIDFAKQYQTRYQHIFYVIGNHEFYGHHLSKMAFDIKEHAKNSNIHVLDNDVFLVDNYAFIGSTLWTDFQLYGLENAAICMKASQAGINDFSQIHYANTYFHTSHAAQMSLVNQKFLKEKLLEYKEYKKIVITHHTPSIKSIPAQYKNQAINGAFSNNLDKMVAKADLWIHGHTHTSFDYTIDKTRVICNPRGYSKYQDRQENVDFKLDLVIEI